MHLFYSPGKLGRRRMWMPPACDLKPVLPPASTAAIAVMATATRAAVLFGTSFINLQTPSVQLSSVQSGDRTLRFFVRAHLDKSKASRLARIPVGDQVDAFNVPIWFKQRSNVCFG